MKFIGILMLLIAAPLACAKGLISKDAFTARYIETAQRAYPQSTFIQTGELEVSVKNQAGIEGTTYLDNAYANYSNAPEHLNEVLSQYIASIKTILQSKPVMQNSDTIFPVIKDKQYVDQVATLMEQKNGDAAPQLYVEPLNDELVVLYAFDTPTSLQFLTSNDLTKLGLEPEALRNIAKQNLQNAVPLHLEGDPAFLSMLVADGSYEASFILFDDIWSKARFPVKGDIVIFIPARDLVLITGSEESEGLARVREIMTDPLNTFSHVVTTKGFVRKNDHWEIFN